CISRLLADHLLTIRGACASPHGTSPVLGEPSAGAVRETCWHAHLAANARARPVRRAAAPAGRQLSAVRVLLWALGRGAAGSGVLRGGAAGTAQFPGTAARGAPAADHRVRRSAGLLCPLAQHGDR